MILYGFNFPDNTSLVMAHLHAYRYWSKSNKQQLPKHVHFQRAIELLWPEVLPSGKKGYVWSEWSYRRLWGWCYNDFLTWCGPSSSGKSTDAAVFALTHWLSAPDATTIIVCSTTKDMLDRRIWREIVRFHSMLKGLYGEGMVPGSRRKQPPMIQLEDPDSKEGESTINAIFGVAVQKGTVAEAIGNMVGIHNEYNVLIIDEMQATREAAVQAFDNLSTGREAKLLGMGNPVSRLDPLGRASEPTKGWGSVSTEMEEWPTRRGLCQFFDGLKSPGVADPEKYHFLLNQKQIDDMARDPGRDSPRFWSQRRGFFPPEGLQQTVITENYIGQFGLSGNKCVWRERYVELVSLDPSFSAGGDSAILTPARVGWCVDGYYRIEFQEQRQIQFKLSAGKAIAYVLADSVMDELKARGLSPRQFSIDCTGSQSVLADVIDREWNITRNKRKDSSEWERCHRVHFYGSCSDLPISTEDPRPASEVYRNRVTELWYLFREYARNGNLRLVPGEALLQFCTRLVLDNYGKGASSERIQVESKREMKDRTGGKSPDHADSVVCLLEYVRSVLSIKPGLGSPAIMSGFSEEQARKHDIDSSLLYSEDVFAEEFAIPGL